MDLGLGDRTYLVTGGTSGLGLATARVLVAERARVVLASRSQEHVDAAVATLGGPLVATGLAADVGAEATAQRLVEVALATYGRLDGALLSTGGPPAGSSMTVTDGAWRDSFESVFLGVVRLARTILAAVEDGGSVVLVLSSSVRSPIRSLGISNGLRPGLAMVAKELADEVGPRGVRVNVVLPGRIATPRITELDAVRTDAETAAVRAAIPMGRYGEPEELGRVAAFLLSPAASYVTGTAVVVDGGAARGI